MFYDQEGSDQKRLSLKYFVLLVSRREQYPTFEVRVSLSDGSFERSQSLNPLQKTFIWQKYYCHDDKKLKLHTYSFQLFFCSSF